MINNSRSLVSKIPLTIGGIVLSAFSVFQIANRVTAVNAAAPCVVTIFGKQYDVAPLQTGHSGGNVFTCGNDMSTVYQSMHGTNVSRIAAFLIATPTPTPTTTPTPAVTPTPTPVVTPTPTVTPTPIVTPNPTPSPVVTPGNSHQDDDHDEIEDEDHDDDRDGDHDGHHDDDHEDREHARSSQRPKSDQHRQNDKSHPNVISQSRQIQDKSKGSDHDD